jgi:predicted secreted hydrolase
MTRRLVALLAVVVLVGGCRGAPILANEPLAFPTPAPATAPPVRPADPISIAFPRDDGPHDRLTEWWYYTGHLRSADGRRFGFEAVIFRAERGAVPAAWASHLALTDESGQRFLYAQRSEIGPQVDHSPRDAAGVPTGFDLQVNGLVAIGASVDGAAGTPVAPWRLSGGGGTDHIDASLAPSEATLAGGSFGLSLDLRSTKPAALHQANGFVDFGPAGSSYYYSRTRLAATGHLELEGQQLEVDGIAWFDHQWGDFVSVGGGGWDWFAINLDDGTDITVSVVLDENGSPLFRYATLVTADGDVFNQESDSIEVAVIGGWKSPSTGRTYPSGWNLMVGGYEIRLVPTIPDQELDTRATTGVIYWEGSQVVAAGKTGSPASASIGGQAYVELTRYGE